MQEEEALAAGRGAVEPIEARDTADGRFEQRVVPRLVLRVRIDPVGEQCKMQFAFGRSQEVNFEPLDLRFDRRRRCQQGRHCHDGPQLRWDAFAQRQSRKHLGAEPERDRAIDERDGNLQGGEETERAKDGELPTGQVVVAHQEQRQREGAERGHDDGADVVARPVAHDPPGGQLTQWCPVTDLRLERASPGTNQVMTRVPRMTRIARRMVRRAQRRLRDFDLRVQRSACEVLDACAVQIARGEIHLRKITAGPQLIVNQADAFEELRPVEFRDQPHAGDDVAHRHAGNALAPVFVPHDRLDRRALAGMPFLQPVERRCHLRVLVTQALHELHGERRRQCGTVRVPFDQCVRLRGVAVDAEQPVGHVVRLFARRAA